MMVCGHRDLESRKNGLKGSIVMNEDEYAGQKSSRASIFGDQISEELNGVEFGESEQVLHKLEDAVQSSVGNKLNSMDSTSHYLPKGELLDMVRIEWTASEADSQFNKLPSLKVAHTYVGQILSKRFLWCTNSLITTEFI